MGMRRLNLNMDENLVAMVDAYAESMHINRSAAISLLCSQHFVNQKNLSTLETFMEIYKAEKSANGSLNDLTK